MIVLGKSIRVCRNCGYFGVIVLFLVGNGVSYQIGNSPFKRAEVLDTEEKFLLEWEVDWNEKRVTFNLTVETLGWIQFGFSNNGIFSGGDVIFGGVRRDGGAYFLDKHIPNGTQVALTDAHQDWTLISAWESTSHTFLSFSRLFETCDPEDYELTVNKVTLIWSYGRDDDERGVSVKNEGTFDAHLLDPDYAPKIYREVNTGNPVIVRANSNEKIPWDTKVWSIHKKLTLPTNHTSYICTFHKAPTLSRKHHWIGFDIHFGNEASRSATHHMVIRKCRAPAGISNREMFEPHLNSPGEPCYVTTTPPPRDTTFPLSFCSDFYFERSIGAGTFFMPNHIGFPFGEAEDEYYLLQMHYDNQQRSANIHIDARLDYFYTSRLRPHDGGLLTVIEDLPALPEASLIPPHSPNHRYFSHCGGECTKRMIPPEGIYISALTLHQHNAGTGIRLRHFRGGRELPWILQDDNFDNRVQPFRHLREDVKVLPGDHLTLECHCSTRENTVVGGFSTSQEMCATFIVYYNRIPDYGVCMSGINSESARENFLGVRNVSWVQEELDWIVHSPREYAGMKPREISDRFIDWTPQKKMELQRFHETSQQNVRCLKSDPTMTLEQFLSLPETPIGVPPTGPVATPENYVGPVSYPLHALPYTPPPSRCSRREE